MRVPVPAWVRRPRNKKTLGDQVYLGILRRRASNREIAVLNAERLRHGEMTPIIDAMITGDEFSIMRLPNLMAQSSLNWCGRYLFLMHVPKTAGTSVRLALTASAGIPALLSYGHLGEVDRSDLPRFSFWPLLIGHGHIDQFPEPHRGLTIFRESRSRYLSRYRQHQRAGMVIHTLVPERAELERRQGEFARQASFEEWLAQQATPTFAAHFTAGVSQRADEFLQTAPEHEVMASLEKGLGRIHYAAWAHDEAAILRAISDATGDPAPHLDRLNTYRSQTGERREPIGPTARAALAECQRQDARAERIAVAAGIIPSLSRSEADGIFEQTAARLGFELT